jgi:hypothetical protein
VSKEKRLKLDNKVVKCIFIDYGVGVKGYRLWDLVAKKGLYSRNVIFKDVMFSSTIVQP